MKETQTNANQSCSCASRLIIKNGVVIDGTGRPGTVQDVLIVGDTIARIGDCSKVEADEIIDAAGMAVCPGFIDPHTHCNNGNVAAYTRQGVTTVIGGNCGFASPMKHVSAAYEKAKRLANFGNLVGLNNVGRVNQARQPTPTEMDTMKQGVAANMAAGALGISSGLIYNPGCYASTEEIIALCKVAATFGGFYTSHIRSESDEAVEAVTEAIRIGRESGLPVHISHHKVSGLNNWGKSVQTMALIDRSIAGGMKVTIDQYPYTASSTSLRVLLPDWALENGNDEIIKKLDSPDTRASIKQHLEKRLNVSYGGQLERVVISQCAVKPELGGKNLRELTALKGGAVDNAAAAEVIMDIVRLDPGPGKIIAIYYSMDEEDVKRIMRHHMTAICSDGAGGGTHPRHYGPFPRVLGRYCRELKLFSLEEAVRKMTSLPAGIVGLNKRGVLKEGYYADITVFNPKTVIDNATFEKPNQAPTGISHVIVNGTIVLKNGELTGKEGGRLLVRNGS